MVHNGKREIKPTFLMEKGRHRGKKILSAWEGNQMGREEKPPRKTRRSPYYVVNERPARPRELHSGVRKKREGVWCRSKRNIQRINHGNLVGVLAEYNPDDTLKDAAQKKKEGGKGGKGPVKGEKRMLRRVVQITKKVRRGSQKVKVNPL